MHGSTNKSPSKYAAENKIHTVICLQIEKTNMVKNPTR